MDTEKLCGLLDEMKRDEIPAMQALTVMGVLAAAQKAALAEGIPYLKEALQSPVPLNALSLSLIRIFDKYAIWENAAAIDSELSTFSTELLTALCETWETCRTPGALTDTFSALIPRADVRHALILPDSLEALGLGLLDLDAGDSLYMGLLGMGMARPAGMGEICKVEIRQEWQRIWRILEFLENETPCTVCANPLVEPLTTGGRLRTFRKVLLQSTAFIRQNAEETPQRSAEDIFGQYVYGMPPVSRGQSLMTISHALRVMESDGRGVVIVDTGALFRGGKEAEIRKRMMEADVIEAVISLPKGMYFALGAERNLVVLNKQKAESAKGKILFINGSELGTAQQGKTLLDEKEIQKILAVVRETREEETGFSASVPASAIRDANWQPEQYVRTGTFDAPGVGPVIIPWREWPKEVPSVPLDEIATVFGGFNLLRSTEESPGGDCRIINFGDVQDGVLQPEKVKRYRSGGAKLAPYYVRPGDIIITSRGTTMKLCQVPDFDGVPMLISQNFYGVRVTYPACDAKMLLLYLESPVGQYLIDKMRSGAVIRLLNRKTFMKLPVPRELAENGKASRDAWDEGELRLMELRKEVETQEKEMRRKAWAAMGIGGLFREK